MGYASNGTWTSDYSGAEIDTRLGLAQAGYTLAANIGMFDGKIIHTIAATVTIPASGGQSLGEITEIGTTFPGKTVHQILNTSLIIEQYPNRDTINGYGLITGSGTKIFASAFISVPTGKPYYYLAISETGTTPPTGTATMIIQFTFNSGD